MSITLKIDNRTRQAKLFIEYVKSLPFVNIIEDTEDEKITKSEFLKDFEEALKEVKEGKTKPFTPSSVDSNQNKPS